jgi:hypothetical protein
VTAYDYYWCFVSDYTETWRPREYKDRTEYSNKKPVFQIDMKTLQIIQEYKSANEAERLSNGKFHSPIISQCCNRINYSSTGGYYWCFVEDWSENWKPRANKNIPKKVRCVETGVVYNSAKEAMEKTGAHKDRIYKCCANPNLTSGGYHWEYVTEE